MPTQRTIGRRVLPALKPGDFAGLSNLKSLWLQHNNLTELPADIFAGLTNLRQLGLSHNRLATLPADLLRPLEQLEALWLHQNRINALPFNVFHSLTHLQKLNLSGNQLTLETLPATAFSGLTALHSLWLNDNDLAGAYSLPPGTLMGLSEQQRLQYETYIDDLNLLPNGIFHGLTGLQSLDLTNRSGQLHTLTFSIVRAESPASTNGTMQLMLTINTAAPFDITLDVVKTGYDEGVVPLTIPKGALSTPPFAVSRLSTSDYTLPGTTLQIANLGPVPTGYHGIVIEPNLHDGVKIVPHNLSVQPPRPPQRPAPTGAYAPDAVSGADGAGPTEQAHPCAGLPASIILEISPDYFAESTERYNEYPAPTGDCLVQLRLRLNPNYTPEGTCAITLTLHPHSSGLKLRHRYAGACAWVDDSSFISLWRVPSQTTSSDQAEARGEAGANRQDAPGTSTHTSEPDPQLAPAWIPPSTADSTHPDAPDSENGPSGQAIRRRPLDSSSSRTTITSRVTGEDVVQLDLWRVQTVLTWDSDSYGVYFRSRKAQTRRTPVSELPFPLRDLIDADRRHAHIPHTNVYLLGRPREYTWYLHGNIESSRYYLAAWWTDPAVRGWYDHWWLAAHTKAHWYSDGFPLTTFPDVDYVAIAGVDAYPQAGYRCWRDERKSVLTGYIQGRSIWDVYGLGIDHNCYFGEPPIREGDSLFPAAAMQRRVASGNYPRAIYY